MTGQHRGLTPHVDEQELAEQLVEQARADGVELIGPGGLLTGLTSKVINTALEGEMTEHLGYMTSTTRWAATGQLPQRHARQDGADAGPSRPASSPSHTASPSSQ